MASKKDKDSSWLIEYKARLKANEKHVKELHRQDKIFEKNRLLALKRKADEAKREEKARQVEIKLKEKEKLFLEKKEKNLLIDESIRNLNNNLIRLKEILISGIIKDSDKFLKSQNQDQDVIQSCAKVLTESSYPFKFNKKFDFYYKSEEKILVVDYQLPEPDNLPSIKNIKYIASKDEVKNIFFSEKELGHLYDDVVYQIILRTLHELFTIDKRNAIEAIFLNGWVTSVDKAHGNEVSRCILSIQTKKDKFEEINLSRANPKACFKMLKGVSCSQLHSLTPIAPILQMNKFDKRFINSICVTGSIDNSTNLAAMDWEDFEHLIRELFEKEFKKNGGECNVTRASRDGGVDAIAFDPDPIRGGKIIIQAKRYTKTVGVSAVRDLYGTVLNEGANKGILVTTADYGPDSYEFARGKPLTLLNGANLLNLLESHGHKAIIDLDSARHLQLTKA